ncbi:MAG: hypothetical protein H6830_00960 [Planctomycetes bacterium]|mgnify:CR=1 FL=1|nr:hypothetical protein [Planctomycetota bacterium]MCB9911073.1 hypothetical protein [Planctomycetota bacterium]MCB9912175.1 hypothetical protein [Planctomycetota bacterium]HPF13097.1 glycosyltransferase [Planctomycetota bacterium]
MILVTVGTQGPFDRLVRAVDAWAAAHPEQRLVAQIGATDFQPAAMESAANLDPIRFERLLREADCIVAHAGMGTILKALELGKPVLIMPRRAALGEQRNEHQLATAERFARLGVVQVAADEHELPAKLDVLVQQGNVERISNSASPELIGRLRGFLGEHLGPPQG